MKAKACLATRSTPNDLRFTAKRFPHDDVEVKRDRLGGERCAAAFVDRIGELSPQLQLDLPVLRYRAMIEVPASGGDGVLAFALVPERRKGPELVERMERFACGDFGKAAGRGNDRHPNGGRRAARVVPVAHNRD